MVEGGASVRRCPDCDTPMRYRDSRPRIMRRYGGKKCRVLIHRMYCPKCHKLHNELPAQLTPFKHYETRVIEDVLDGVVEEDSKAAENGPSEITMKRWRSWFQKNTQRILGYIRTARQRAGMSLSASESEEPLLERLRKAGQGWGSVRSRPSYIAPADFWLRTAAEICTCFVLLSP